MRRIARHAAIDAVAQVSEAIETSKRARRREQVPTIPVKVSPVVVGGQAVECEAMHILEALEDGRAHKACLDDERSDRDVANRDEMVDLLEPPALWSIRIQLDQIDRSRRSRRLLRC